MLPCVQVLVSCSLPYTVALPCLLILLPALFALCADQGENNVGGVQDGVRSGCCSIGCPNATGQNACRQPCEASGQLCAEYYQCQYTAMVEDWRAKWNGGSDLTSIKGRPAGPRPMIAVELAPYVDGTSDYGFPNVAMLRQA